MASAAYCGGTASDAGACEQKCRITRGDRDDFDERPTGLVCRSCQHPKGVHPDPPPGPATTMIQMLAVLKEVVSCTKSLEKELKKRAPPHPALSIVVSQCNTDSWEKLVKRTGFSIESVNLAEFPHNAALANLVSQAPVIDTFTWDESREDAEEHKRAYEEFFKKALGLNDRSFSRCHEFSLTCNAEDFHCNVPLVRRAERVSRAKRSPSDILLKGKTDIIVYQIATRSDSVVKAAVVLFELKKDLKSGRPQHFRQCRLELIAAHVRSLYAPVAVLTDLSEFWMMWLDGLVIKEMRCDQATAFFLVKQWLLYFDQPLASIPAVMPIVSCKLQPIKERNESDDDEDSGNGGSPKRSRVGASSGTVHPASAASTSTPPTGAAGAAAPSDGVTHASVHLPCTSDEESGDDNTRDMFSCQNESEDDDVDRAKAKQDILRALHDQDDPYYANYIMRQLIRNTPCLRAPPLTRRCLSQ